VWDVDGMWWDFSVTGTILVGFWWDVAYIRWDVGAANMAEGRFLELSSKPIVSCVRMV